jgi:methylmalonyl-CoA mutase N-terminal domain/subunit
VQVLAQESGVSQTADPLGGSFLVEALTLRMQEAARETFRRIAEQGGMIAAVENGFFRREIAESAFADQERFDAGEQLIVGVNAFQQPDEEPLEVLQLDPSMEREQVASLTAVKSRRSGDEVRRALDRLKKAAESGRNVMPELIAAAEARVTVQEAMDAMAESLGRFRSAAWSST